MGIEDVFLEFQQINFEMKVNEKIGQVFDVIEILLMMTELDMVFEIMIGSIKKYGIQKIELHYLEASKAPRATKNHQRQQLDISWLLPKHGPNRVIRSAGHGGRTLRDGV